MQRVFSSPNLVEVAQFKDMLEGAHIACFVRNENSIGLVGAVPLTDGTPELWIEEDKDLEAALRIKGEWQAAPKAEGGNWACAECGESSEPQFDSCWKCGAARKG